MRSVTRFARDLSDEGEIVMSASSQAPVAGERCGKWMPRKEAWCARKLGHRGECRTAEALVESRQRKSGRRRDSRLRDDPIVVARWRRAHKFVRLGITEAEFNAMLEAQGRACAMCFTPFGEEDRICADHDHACCPKQVKATAKTCGKCIRGLLCFRCNTALGYVEKYTSLASAYLARVADAKAA